MGFYRKGKMQMSIKNTNAELTGMKKFHVVYLGESGFPFGFASMNKLILICKALLDVGVHVSVINRKGKLNPNGKINLDPTGEYQGIKYIYTTGSVYRPSGFLRRNISKIKGKVEEFRYLWQLKKRGELDAGIISSLSFVHVLTYRLHSLLLGFPIVINYFEYGPFMQHHKGILKKINDRLFDPFLIRWMDGTLPISEFLVKRVKAIAPAKPFLKVPVLCDFEQFEIKKNDNAPPYFLFCGSLDYREIIDFIIQAFTLLPPGYKVNLCLVVGETKPGQLDRFKNDLRKMGGDSGIKVYSNIDYKDLVELYMNAMALLIPLRPTRQDIARFPHKIGEYVASGNPLITTNVGEISYYFKHLQTALIAEKYDATLYSKWMKFVVDNPEEAAAIGKRGKEMGRKEFDYLNYSQKLKSFLEELNCWPEKN